MLQYTCICRCEVGCTCDRKAPVTLDRIEPPNVKWMRILVIRWQKGQSGRKTETTDVHAPDMERLKRTGNEYVTHGFSSTSQMFPNE